MPTRRRLSLRKTPLCPAVKRLKPFSKTQFPFGSSGLILICLYTYIKREIKSKMKVYNLVIYVARYGNNEFIYLDRKLAVQQKKLLFGCRPRKLVIPRSFNMELNLHERYFFPRA